MKAINRIFFVIAGLIVLISCNKGDLYFKYNKVEKENWYRDSVLTFTIDTLKSEQYGKYSISLELTTSMVYPYSEIYLEVNHNLNDIVFYSDTIRYKVANDFGKRLGSGNGSLRQISLPYKSDVWLNRPRTYEINIAHLMYADPLKGVDKVGLRIYKDEN